MNKDILVLPGVNVPLYELKSKKELFDYFNEHGPTHSALMDFCEFYREKYHNELCWPYPISDGKHLGTFLMPVKEGILSLPYDDADKVDYELFCIEDACMFDAESMEVFINDWDRFSNDLKAAMLGMKLFLQKDQA